MRWEDKNIKHYGKKICTSVPCAEAELSLFYTFLFPDIK